MACVNKLPCIVSFSTTATVYKSNAPNNPFNCTSFCRDGCCYVFNPSNRCIIWGPLQIIGWLILAVSIIIALASLFEVGYSRYFMWYIKSEIDESKKVNNDFSQTIINFTYGSDDSEQKKIANASSKVSVDILELKRRGKIKIRRVCIALVGLASANAAAMILYSNSNNEIQASGLQLSSSVKVLCYYVWATCAVSFVLLMYYVTWPVRTDTDITAGVAGCVAALLIVCYMPVVGGYDTVSGIAFTDIAAYNQSFHTNQVRYDNIVAASNTLFGFAISFLLIANTNIFFGILNGVR